LTVWVIAVEVLALKLSSALYTAVIECVPTERELRVKVAWPLPSTNLEAQTGHPIEEGDRAGGRAGAGCRRADRGGEGDGLAIDNRVGGGNDGGRRIDHGLVKGAGRVIASVEVGIAAVGAVTE